MLIHVLKYSVIFEIHLLNFTLGFTLVYFICFVVLTRSLVLYIAE